MQKILIIEDNPVNLKLINDILTAKGYTILQATTGIEGIETAQENCTEISLILLDLKLPDMEGIEVIKSLKADKNTVEIPVIVVSAHAMESDIKATKQAGCADYITKPINIRDFWNKVNATI